MSEALDNLTAKVEAQTTVIDSAATLLATLANEIRDNAGDEDALNALADRLDANTTELANAVEANTVTTDTPEQPVPGEGEEPTA